VDVGRLILPSTTPLGMLTPSVPGKPEIGPCKPIHDVSCLVSEQCPDRFHAFGIVFVSDSDHS
jgi:hypothetical protein